MTRFENATAGSPQYEDPANQQQPIDDFQRIMQGPATIEARIDIEDGQMVPKNFEGIWKLASMYRKSGLAPRGMETTEKLAIAIAHGGEIGLSPMQSIQCVAAINGRPSIYGDAALALVYSKGILEQFKEEFSGSGDDAGYTCTAKRKDMPDPVVQRFTVADAKRAKLWGKSGPWTDHPRRMLQFRARGFALRDAAADVLRGLILAEEAQDLPESASAENDRKNIGNRLEMLEKKNGNGNKTATLPPPTLPPADIDAQPPAPEDPSIAQESPQSDDSQQEPAPMSDLEKFEVTLHEAAEAVVIDEKQLANGVKKYLLKLGKVGHPEKLTAKERDELLAAVKTKSGYFAV